jgi:hypothetical protein
LETLTPQAPIGLNKKRWRKVQPTEVEAWVKLSDQGQTTRAIGRIYGREHSIIRKWLLKAGVSQEQIKRNQQIANKEKRNTLNTVRCDKGIFRKHTALSKQCYMMLDSAYRRSQKQGLAFDLTLDFILRLHKQQHGLCALTGLTMDMGSPKIGRSRPFIPSLDRIEADKGYTQTNVRLVCWAVNAALSQWGEAQFASICRAYIRRCDGN